MATETTSSSSTAAQPVADVLANAREFANSEAFQTLLAGIDDLQTEYLSNTVIGAHVNCVAIGLRNLASAVGSSPST